MFGNAARPIAERSLRHAERGLAGLADANTARSGIVDRKERQQRAGATFLVTVIEVICARIVEVDGRLDEAKAKRLRVELAIARYGSGERRDVMDASV